VQPEVVWNYTSDYLNGRLFSRNHLNPIEETEGILQLLSLRLEINVSEGVTILHRMWNESKGKVTRNVTGSPAATEIESLFREIGMMTWQSFVRNRLPLLKLPDNVLEALRKGKLPYNSAKEIARIKDKKARNQLLDEAVERSLSLNQIKGRVKELNPVKTEEPPNQEPDLKQRFKQQSSKLVKSKAWDNPEKRKRIEKLLAELEGLIE